jgi:hypothetical protein
MKQAGIEMARQGDIFAKDPCTALIGMPFALSLWVMY